MSLPVPAGPVALDGAWLGAALGRPVGPLSVTRIGEAEGFSGGALYRLAAAGESWIAKLAPDDPAARAALAAANRREVVFYRDLAAGLPVPRCLHAAADAATGASVLLLEDLASCRPGRFRAGLSADEADAAAAALARVHAAWWERTELAALSGSGLAGELGFPGCWAAYPAALADLLPGAALPAPLRTLGDRIAADPAAVLGPLFDQGPLTLLHRDCQADNLAFRADGAAVLFDWQFFGRGRGAADLSYLAATSLDPPLRRRHERRLVEGYHRRLVSAGITGYGLEDCRRDYAAAVALKLVLTVVATVRFDNAAPQRREWRRRDLARLSAFAEDHGIGAGRVSA